VRYAAHRGGAHTALVADVHDGRAGEWRLLNALESPLRDAIDLVRQSAPVRTGA
jgi:hypothetical protein